MSSAIQLGPLLLPYMLLVVLASVGTALAVGMLVARDAPADTEQALWRALLFGVVAARLAFVVEYRSSYLASPLAVLDIRDGGWNPAFGLAGAWLAVLRRGRDRRAARRPARWSLAAGTVVFAIGTAVLSLQAASGARLPDLAFPSLDGRTVRLPDFIGKPTVVNLWATWCPPCVREMPVLDDAQRRHPDIHFIFLNQGEDAAHVARWLGGRQLSLSNVLLDPGSRASAEFSQRGYPATLFFDARGEHVSTRIGELSRATLEDRLKAVER